MKTIQGKAILNLIKNVKDVERFKRLTHPDVLIDAKLTILTPELETITIDVLDFIELDFHTVEEAEELV